MAFPLFLCFDMASLNPFLPSCAVFDTFRPVGVARDPGSCPKFWRAMKALTLLLGEFREERVENKKIQIRN